MERLNNLMERLKPYIYAIFIAVSFGGYNIVAKVSLDRGMSQFVLVAYSFGFGTLTVAILALLFERKNESKLSLPICVNIFFLGCLCALARVLYYVGLEDTSSTFAAAISNLTPSITFILALLCRMEKVDICKCSGRAKIIGTLISLGGATLMTLYKGLTLVSVHSALNHRHYTAEVPLYRNLLKGAIIFLIQMVSILSFFILQTMTIKKYPAPLRLTSLMSLASTLISTIAAVIVDHRASQWRLSWDITLLAPLYTGIIYFGISMYVLTLIVKQRGPVFSSAFQPLTLVVVTIMSLPIFGEPLHLGGVVGRIFFYAGLQCASPTFVAAMNNLVPSASTNIVTLVLKTRGPDFVSAFRLPVTVIVSVMGFFVLSDTLYLGGIIGLYAILWAKEYEKNTRINIQADALCYNETIEIN